MPDEMKCGNVVNHCSELPEGRALLFACSNFRHRINSGRAVVTDRVTDGLVAAAPFVEHPREHGYRTINVIVDSHLGLVGVKSVEPPDVLLERAPPRDWQREKECIEPAVVEALADVAPRRDDDARRVLRDRGEFTRDGGSGLRILATLEHDNMRDLSSQRASERVRVRFPLSKHEW